VTEIEDSQSLLGITEGGTITSVSEPQAKRQIIVRWMRMEQGNPGKAAPAGPPRWRTAMR